VGGPSSVSATIPDCLPHSVIGRTDCGRLSCATFYEFFQTTDPDLPAHISGRHDAAHGVAVNPSPWMSWGVVVSITSTLKNVKSLSVPFSFQRGIVRSVYQVVIAVRVLEHMPDADSVISALLPVG
jgi:hypothetical protein